jgi:hypothetical protein
MSFRKGDRVRVRASGLQGTVTAVEPCGMVVVAFRHGRLTLPAPAVEYVPTATDEERLDHFEWWFRQAHPATAAAARPLDEGGR